MKVLLIGSGGREHALAWKLSQSELVTELVCAPGNAGIAEVADIVPVAADDIIGLLALVQRDQYDFVIVGPEQPLALGLVDALQDLGAGYGVFTDLKEAKAYLKTMKPPYVLKADGLKRLASLPSLTVKPPSRSSGRKTTNALLMAIKAPTQAAWALIPLPPFSIKRPWKPSWIKSLHQRFTVWPKMDTLLWAFCLRG